MNRKKQRRRPPPLPRYVGAGVDPKLARDVARVLEADPSTITPSSYRAVLQRFQDAVGLLPPEDDLPLEPSEGAGSTVFGSGAGPNETPFGDSSETTSLDPSWNVYEVRRQQAYVDYEDMVAQFPEFSRAVDAISEGATSNDHGEPPYRAIFAPSVEAKLQDELLQMDARLDLHKEIKPVCGSSKHMGDLFGELVAAENNWIVLMLARNARTMYRVHDSRGLLKEFQQKFPGGSKTVTFAPGQIVHLRAGHQWGAVYGTSMFRSGRFVYRKYALMDDAMVVNRLVRAIMRYEHQIDVKDLDLKQAEAHIKRIMERNRRHPVFTSDGRLDLQTRAMGDMQDFYTGIRTPGMGGVRAIEGSRTTGVISDVMQLYRRLLVTIPVPPSFLGIEADVNARATVNEEAINYARYLRATQQRELAPFVAKIYRRQAALLGRALTREELEIRFGPVSVLDQRMWAETLRIKAEAAKVLGVDYGMPVDFVVKYVLGLPPDVADEVIEEMQDDVDDGAAPAPTVPAPGENDPPEAEREGKRARRALRSSPSLARAMAAVSSAMNFIVEERRRTRATAITPTNDAE